MAYISGTNGNNWLFGTSEDDIILGFDGHDLIYGGYGNDTLIGGSGIDSVHGGWGDDLLVIDSAGLTGAPYAGTGRAEYHGDAGNDRFSVTGLGPWTTEVHGGKGYDVLDFSWYADGVIMLGTRAEGGKLRIWEVEHVRGSSFDDLLIAGDDVRKIEGLNGDDILIGGARSDILDGGNGDDRLNGRQGYDEMTGGNGADVFVFSPDDNTGPFNEGWGRITDFSTLQGDRIDLSAFAGTLTFIGGAEFQPGWSPQLRVERDPANWTRARVEVDIDGNGTADGHIDLTLKGWALPDADDFIL